MKFTDPEFKALQRKWYEKIKKKGFQDIEEEKKVGYYQTTGFRHGSLDPDRMEARREYFTRAGQFLHSRKWDSRDEKRIWELHAKGDSIRAIASAIGHSRSDVHRIIFGLASKMMTRETVVVIRPFNAKEDEAFVYATWTKNQFYAIKEPVNVSKAVWFSNKCASIKKILETGNVYVACLSDDPDFIIGYSVFKDDQPEWIYIKKKYRHHGIEALLLSKNKENANGKTNRSSDQTGITQKASKAA